MNEQLKKINEQMKRLWTESTRRNKVLFFTILTILLIAIIAITIATTKKNYVPLYTNMSPDEVGQIKEELDAENVAYEITDGGTSIKVNKEESDRLIVELEGYMIQSS